jgi:hypothetical protein
MPSVAQQPLVCSNNSVEESVITACDTIQGLVNGKHIHRLLLRFAYIHLVRVIDGYRAAAAKDRIDEGDLRLPNPAVTMRLVLTRAPPSMGPAE